MGTLHSIRRYFQTLAGKIARIFLIGLGFLILCFGVFSKTPWSPSLDDTNTVHADVPAPPAGDSAGSGPGGGDCGADSGSC
jgi:hypothetical protein